ncbi:VanW family protein [Paenibacillus radicis (ex Xue et al. 2023)]|uniref:VanW family protein n=1 Tax=Paenibacillus radicis (ex Xue et al. 2023) TaxID=2972489 RepID=A0ABT1YJ37_9BACL|nr:VanW family protein [Paenibacillus radicis (ex Xue et al. 2023)]MCR8632429.1 VanW family protein [Paenibacillus radicis (ex Xue et al. 2023)]
MVRYRVSIRYLLVGLLLFAASACASMAWYGLRDELPHGLTINNWNVGGTPLTELERQLTLKREQMLQQIVRLNSTQPNVPLQPADWTMEQLGLDIPLQPLLARFEPLRSGSPFQRAVYRWKLRDQKWTLSFDMDASILQKTLKRGFPALYEAQPQDAQRIIGPNDAVSYVPEVPVMRIDEQELLKQLRGVIPPIEAVAAKKEESPLAIALPFIKEEPKLTVPMLQSQKVERKISEFTTTFLQNGEGRIHNIRSTASSIHDLIMKPGDVFDYATYIAETEQKFGFKEAPVILNGKLVPGIGGGICQVSSTLYNAVLRAGLDIVERRNHSLPVSYVPLGQDATFASGYINFKFRNSTPNYLLIRTSTDEQKITVKLFGQIPADLSYTIESKTVQTLPSPLKYVVNPRLPNGKQEKISDGKPGYIVETYRYKMKDGVTVSQERISRDTYSAQPTVIARNQAGVPEGQEAPNPSRQPQTPLLEDGIKGPVFR